VKKIKKWVSACIAILRRLFRKPPVVNKKRTFNLCDIFPVSYSEVDKKAKNIERSHGAKAFKHKKKRLCMAKASRRRNRAA
jgi:hypothetical protein